MALLIASQGSKNAHTDKDPEIQIKLDQQGSGNSYAYTTDEVISGTVSIAVGREIDFDDLDIAFEGMCCISIFIDYC